MSGAMFRHAEIAMPSRRRRGARAAAASAAAFLPLLALTFATLESAVVFATSRLLGAIGLPH